MTQTELPRKMRTAAVRPSMIRGSG
jgi:hypothetical protein